MFSASLKNKTFEIDSTDDGFLVNGKVVQWDLVKVTEGYFHIVYGTKSYTAELLKADYATKSFQFRINGNNYSVAVKDRFDLLLEKMGMNNNAASKLNNIKAPMPGLIIDLKVKQGDSVKTGDALIILEAMKMENIIKSPGDGTVRTMRVKKGESVEKNQVLIEF
jgi:biotin carboxyl carrier protein